MPAQRSHDLWLSRFHREESEQLIGRDTDTTQEPVLHGSVLDSKLHVKRREVKTLGDRTCPVMSPEAQTKLRLVLVAQSLRSAARHDSACFREAAFYFRTKTGFGQRAGHKVLFGSDKMFFSSDFAFEAALRTTCHHKHD
ncbi:unnamed protein product [Pleuronectes platessa]|uniref:Uncharacterized protein n=1 Tax=Pleuronectes platessa TaxID=8262 RepID=A0A9N7UEN6_PLEPL|nr:unnamed protein product [Pleuronectes platessa]